MQRILNARLLLFHLDFSRSAHFDHGNTTSQLGYALLQFLAVIVRRRVLDLNADFADATFDRLGITRAIDDSRVVLVHGDALGITQVLERGALKIETHFLRDHGTTSEDGNVLQHGFTAITEARRLTGGHLNDTAHVIDHQRCEGFAFNVLGNNDQRTRRLGNLLKHR